MRPGALVWNQQTKGNDSAPQRTQQQRPESPTVTPPSMRVNRTIYDNYNNLQRFTLSTSITTQRPPGITHLTEQNEIY